LLRGRKGWLKPPSPVRQLALLTLKLPRTLPSYHQDPKKVNQILEEVLQFLAD
jgi:hypothetical protein